MIIHTHIPRRKPKKPNAKQRAQRASWQALLDKYDIKPGRKITKSKLPSDPVIIRRETPNYPSLNSSVGSTAKKEPMQYTGDAMLGIGQLHKSNAVPIFKAQDAIDISKMRRG
jgi:hypothetical protein